MWIHTSDGFYSVVQWNGDPKSVLVRTRSRADMQRLYEALGLTEELKYVIDYDPKADYPFRLRIWRSQWTEYLAGAVKDLHYEAHAKESMTKGMPAGTRSARLNTLMKAWSLFTRIEDEPDAGVPKGRAYWGWMKPDKESAKKSSQPSLWGGSTLSLETSHLLDEIEDRYNTKPKPEVVEEDPFFDVVEPGDWSFAAFDMTGEDPADMAKQMIRGLDTEDVDELKDWLVSVAAAMEAAV